MKLKSFRILSNALLLSAALTSCESFLDKEPLSYVTPEDYLRSDDQIQAIANGFYTNVAPATLGAFSDGNTDIQAGLSANGMYAEGQWKVALDNSNWNWEQVRNLNYAINATLDRFEKGEIKGSTYNIEQYIGELYFFRAYRYFIMMRNWGDLPIVTEVMPANEEILVAANKRRPHNEVARFIIANLDTARTYLKDGFDATRNRVSRDVATLTKSRVALYEGTWLKYFSGTPFVANGEGWPGKSKDYNADYQYKAGSVENESKYFLEIAAEAAQEVAEKYKGQLTQNTGIVPQADSDVNPYFYMFGAVDMSVYPDILMWRAYDKSQSVTNSSEIAVQFGNWGVGVTRNGVERFVMNDGKPWYASHNGFAYDDSTIGSIREVTDPRLSIFLKEPGQKNIFKNMESSVTHSVPVEPVPDITNDDSQKGYSTGYTLRKGGTFDKALCENGLSYNGAISFRATEALLNYIEAEYLLTNNIQSGHILEYWKTIRTAAGFKGDAIDPMTTINATDMAMEKSDWGSYSAGKQLTDAVLFNIRRERCCELFGEGLRMFDLIRWRSFDQMIDEPYHVEGFHLWNTPMEVWYDQLVYDGSSSANVSSPEVSEYLRPYEKNMTSGNLFRNGYTWKMAHYLQPMPIRQFLLTAADHASVEQSSLYQNPYWPTTADMPAEK
ncbi:RagB/SusD family nutrient uptake outer membrane protein [Bacteroides sp.]|uniref:RagB/SusD family nutrient uptake outer membrane protein n=1 Tax=Bacteroides sp. TaxID=29523 RepID=UPI0023BB3738|nr:RagB/SusD family nutrient uptake outer membrane protein [Bacteroides sp.]MDE6217212.1 RagB/SusD family nutrient uptake outer membrane protein [Bacteroides sp.]